MEIMENEKDDITDSVKKDIFMYVTGNYTNAFDLNKVTIDINDMKIEKVVKIGFVGPTMYIYTGKNDLALAIEVYNLHQFIIGNHEIIG